MGTREKLEYIIDTGEVGEGDPETVWRRLAQKELRFRDTTDRGRPRRRAEWQSYIVVWPQRGSIKNVVNTCDARHWTGISRGSGHYHTVTHDGGPTVRKLNIDGLPDQTLHGIADELFRFMDFLNENGAVFHGAISGGGLALFKETIETPVRMWAPNIITEALWPGRAEYFHSEARLFMNMAYYDLKEAYPTALSEEAIPTRWHHSTNPDKWRKHPDGFSFAHAYIPYDASPPHPLPLRLNPSRRNEHLVWPRGFISGWWNHRDMLIADELGYLGQVDESWLPDAHTEVFQSPRWQELRLELRALGPFGKMADNALWGLLSYDGTKQKRVRWLDKEGTQSKKVADIQGIRETHSLGVALAATSRVREKLWRGMAAANAVYCATDGMIAKYPSPSPLPSQWAIKIKYNMIEIKDSGFYRWCDDEHMIWQYLRGGKRHYDAHGGKKRDRIGDTVYGTLPPMSIRELHLHGFMKELLPVDDD